MRRALIATTALALTLPAMTTQAADLPPRDRLSLSASATVEVPRDTLGVVFATTKEGADAAAVQTALKQALDAALAEARKAAKPGQVEVQTGNFSLTPRYAPKAGQISGWQGIAELVVEGRDSVAIAQLVGRITSLSVQRVGYSLSREARERVEGEVTAQAIARYRAKAGEMSRLFGYGGYVIGEVNVNADDNGARPMFKAMRAMAAPMADEALPTEAGKAAVTVSVNGSVQMTQEALKR